MEAALQLVLGLVQISAIQLRHTETAPLIPLAGLPARLLSELVPSIGAKLARRLQALALSAPAAETVAELRQIAEQLAQATRGDPQRSARLEAAAQHVQTIAVLNQDVVDGQHAIRHLHIDLANSPLLRYVQEWHVRSAAPEANRIIVCLVSAQAGECVVRLRGQAYVERRVALHYRLQDVNPWIGLRALAAMPGENRPIERQLWQQRPLPDDDLAVYTEQERYKGRIASRRLDLPIVVEGAPFRITLAAAEGAYVVATDIIDETDRLLVRVIRWPPVGQSGDASMTD